MSIVILVGGQSCQGNYEHRYLVEQFLATFPNEIKAIITTEPVRRSIPEKIKRNLKRGNFGEKLARTLYNRKHPKDPELLGNLLFDKDKLSQMPGNDLITVVSGHNNQDCEDLLESIKPDIIVVYGTALIRDNIFTKAGNCTLNMHTGLSPYYRGDSTLFWPIYYNDREKLGVTVHQLVPEVDGGDIVYTGNVEYERGDTEAHIFAKGVKVGTALYLQAVKDAQQGKIKYHPQDLSLGREFRWIHRTVAAERKVTDTLAQWELENPEVQHPADKQEQSELPRRKAG